MNKTADNIFTFFCSFIAQDPSTLEQLSPHKNGIYQEQGRLVFTLPGLYQHLVTFYNYKNNHVSDNADVDQSAKDKQAYLIFRKQLYNSDINTRLNAVGYGVDIYRSLPNIDDTYYQLSCNDNN